MPRIRRRAAMLCLFAVVWVTVGLRIIEQPRAVASHTLPLEYLPTWLRAGIWFASAACAVVAAWWPRGRDKWGWVALTIPASMRAASFCGAAALGWMSWWSPAAWVAILLVILLLSSWPEEPNLPTSGGSP